MSPVRRGAAPAAAAEPQSLLDSAGYPSSLSLYRIQHFDLLKYRQADLLALVRANWWMDYGWKQRGAMLWMSTGGWSGNEAVIAALQRNLLFWSLRFDSLRRGGHYAFRLGRPFGKTPYHWKGLR